jgi:hypothetical protein
MKALDFSATIIPEPRDRIEAVTPDTTHLKQNRDTINKPKSSASLIGSNEETKIAAGKHRDQRSRFLAQCFPCCVFPLFITKKKGPSFFWLGIHQPPSAPKSKPTRPSYLGRRVAAVGKDGRRAASAVGRRSQAGA